MSDQPTLADLQHWTRVIGRGQQMMMEAGLDALKAQASAVSPAAPGAPILNADAAVARMQDYWTRSFELWQHFLDPAKTTLPPAAPDKRFKAEGWQAPVFDWMRRSYQLLSDHMLREVEALEGVPARQKEQLRFATRGFVEAMSPANFPFTNPEVIDRTLASGGENLLRGLQNMLADLSKGQLTHTDSSAFELGRNLATTPGKVVHRTPLYELIQYAPATESVLATPLVIFPPWINRFYILDLTPEKSFIRWCVDQGITVFMVSWKSADESLTETVLDDYVEAQIGAIDTIRDLLSVDQVHAIGYCVAGTTLAATLAVLAARDQAAKVASATFFTAQVDFAAAGELTNFITDEQLAMIRTLSPQGVLDGRYMAATFNLLRGRDLIWTYVTNNYLLGDDYPPFDLLHWNGDTTNLPARWHMDYLTDLYRDNRLVQPGALSVNGTPIDLTRVNTPTYIQAGREDHIAPAESVWRVTGHFAGPLRFVLAGSGHIAGVVNPPAANKYQYWTNDAPANTLDEFVSGARETKGSWWPDWLAWLRGHGDAAVAPTGARVPGEGALPALEEAPGSYVRAR
jgi:polyhydroxyalkanoate synthase